MNRVSVIHKLAMNCAPADCVPLVNTTANCFGGLHVRFHQLRFTACAVIAP